ncbi:transthyretin-like family protein [Flavobacterium terrae]|uniref:Carboxypeptidase regulatory-like domain-containing protein n=1 Tax=Flavobacterium terrae TaxID=415425 RepID=A0A1M6DKP1_9FLAO|nr:hypothetical protein [Flavobacterium terrae]SHI73740.1 hypothetical protein SAMN05444363_1503 [Flavobacterium terrae]
MKRIFKGTLKGQLCEDCLEYIANAEVLLYLPYRKEVANSAVANPKETFHLVTPEEAKLRENLLIAKTVADENGNFEFSIDEKYANSAFDIDFVCGTVPPKIPKPKRTEPLQFHITTLAMEWRMDESQDYIFFKWEYEISYKFWCYIRGHYFDAWVICGRLVNCKTNTPIANAKVTAFDADFLTDDNLGTATTDSNGHFRIDYSSIKFKQTFLSPLINVETDPGLPLTFQSGPDVYFKAEIAGTTLIDETRANARKNVSYCLCVKLCSEVNVVNPEDPNFPSAWTGIGNAFSASYGTNSYDFDIDGYAGSGKNALFGTIRLTGQAALKSASGNPIEYRFLISDITTPNGSPSPATSNFTKIVGVTPNLFAPSVVSKLTRKVYSPINNEIFVTSDQSDFDSQGWFDVNHAIERALINAGLTLADLNLYNIIEEDTLISLNTTALTTAPNVPGTINPGQAIPAANKIPIEKFAIRFEIREVVNKPLSQFNVVPGNGKTLNSVIMNNNPVVLKLSIAELETNGLCTPINGTLHAKYTVYHPHLTSSSLHLRNNSNTVNRAITDGIVPLSSNTNPAIDERTNNSCQLNNPPNDMTRCTYILKLYARARMHNGDVALSDSGPVEQIFFYDV